MMIKITREGKRSTLSAHLKTLRAELNSAMTIQLSFYKLMDSLRVQDRKGKKEKKIKERNDTNFLFKLFESLRNKGDLLDNKIFCIIYLRVIMSQFSILLKVFSLPFSFWPILWEKFCKIYSSSLPSSFSFFLIFNSQTI